MKTIYKSTTQGELKITDKVEDGVWINLVNPTEMEIQQVAFDTNVDVDFVRAATDEEERPRIELDDEPYSLLIAVDIPSMEIEEGKVTYETFPLGIIFTTNYIVTVCLKENFVLDGFISNNIKTFYTFKKSRFILQILYKNAVLYLQYLRQIEKQSDAIQTELIRSMHNRELIQLLNLDKSLVYLSTSLKSNELVMERLSRFDFIKKYDEDRELLEDTIVENKQAIEMAKIYSDILGGTMDAYASFISNNLNNVMKFLAAITIVMAVPTMISGFFGMNVPVPLTNVPNAFWLIIIGAVVICVIVLYLMAKKKML